MKIAGIERNHSASGKIGDAIANGKTTSAQRNRNHRAPEAPRVAVRRDPPTKENSANRPTRQDAIAKKSQTRRRRGSRHETRADPAPTKPRLTAIEGIRRAGRDEAIADAIGQERNNNRGIDRTKKTHGRDPTQHLNYSRKTAKKPGKRQENQENRQNLTKLNKT
jgi:hypothetical protein